MLSLSIDLDSGLQDLFYRLNTRLLISDRIPGRTRIHRLSGRCGRIYPLNLHKHDLYFARRYFPLSHVLTIKFKHKD